MRLKMSGESSDGTWSKHKSRFLFLKNNNSLQAHLQQTKQI